MLNPSSKTSTTQSLLPPSLAHLVALSPFPFPAASGPSGALPAAGRVEGKVPAKGYPRGSAAQGRRLDDASNDGWGVPEEETQGEWTVM